VTYHGQARRTLDPRTGRLTRVLGPVPRVVRAARLDNLVLVPASMLLARTNYQAIATSLPRGQVLIVLPSEDRRVRETCNSVVSLLRAKGKKVITLTIDQLKPVS
jgi:hypothetical protein